jgi:mannose PTS system EIIA component
MIGIVIIAHCGLGDALIRCAAHVTGTAPQALRSVSVTGLASAEALLEQAREAIAQADGGAGVLVLADMLGGTPANVAARTQVPGRVAAVAGVSLPMLLRVLTYRSQPLGELVQKALSGGRDGVVLLAAEAGASIAQTRANQNRASGVCPDAAD